MAHAPYRAVYLRLRAAKSAGSIEMSRLKKSLETGALAHYLLGVDENAAWRENTENAVVKSTLLLITQMMNGES